MQTGECCRRKKEGGPPRRSPFRIGEDCALELEPQLQLHGPRILVSGRDAEAGAPRQGQRRDQVPARVEGQVPGRHLVETFYRADKYHYSVNLSRVKHKGKWTWRHEARPAAKRRKPARRAGSRRPST